MYLMYVFLYVDRVFTEVDFRKHPIFVYETFYFSSRIFGKFGKKDNGKQCRYYEHHQKTSSTNDS